MFESLSIISVDFNRFNYYLDKRKITGDSQAYFMFIYFL